MTGTLGEAEGKPRAKPWLADLRPLETLRNMAAVVLPPLITIGVLLLVWQVLCSQEGASLPPPSKVLKDTWELIRDPFFDNGGTDVGLFWQILASLKRVSIGFSLAAVCGVALGVLIGQSSFAYRGLDPIFQVLRTVPPLAWLPISLAAFKDSNPSAIFVIFITAIWPIILNTSAGVQNLPASYRNVGRVLALNPIQYFVRIVLPATVPHIFTGLRIGVGMSWLAIVAAEMVQGGTGIGFFIWDSYNSSLLSDTIVALLWIGMVGFSLDRIVAAVGRLVART